MNDIYETSFILDPIVVIRCGLLGLILNQHHNYFNIWWFLYKARQPHGSPWLPLWETLSCTFVCFAYYELPCLSLCSPAPDLVDRDKSKELYSFPVSETCRQTEALESEHIFYTALPSSTLTHYVFFHLMGRVSNTSTTVCAHKIFHCMVIKTSNMDLQTPRIKVPLSVCVSHTA